MLAEMWLDIKQLFVKTFETHPMRKLGFIWGVIIGLLILLLGLPTVLFAFFCGVIGLYIGSRFDEEGDGDLIGDILRNIENSLSERFR